MGPGCFATYDTQNRGTQTRSWIYWPASAASAGSSPLGDVSQMSLKVFLLLALGLFSAMYLFLLFRISNFRRDNPDPGSTYFGSPGSSLWEVLNRQTYDERGGRLYPYLLASLLATGVCWFLFFGLLIAETQT